jgi:hypothetical protein
LDQITTPGGVIDGIGKSNNEVLNRFSKGIDGIVVWLINFDWYFYVPADCQSKTQFNFFIFSLLVVTNY